MGDLYNPAKFGAIPRSLGRIIVDEDVPGDTARRLSESGLGIRARSVAEIDGLRGGPDDEVLRYAAYNGLVLVVCDRDFGKLIFKDRLAPPPGLMYLKGQPHDAPAIVLSQLMGAPEHLAGNFVTWERGRTRNRNMPVDDFQKQRMLEEIASHRPTKVSRINGVWRLAGNGSS